MDKKQKVMTFEEWRAEAHRLRTGMFVSEGKFFLHLLEGESLFENWNLGKTYDEFLVDEALVKSERWRAFRVASKLVEPSKVEALGYAAFIELARRSTPERREAYENNVLAFAREHGHPPSDETAKNMARTVDPPPPRDTRLFQRQMSYAKLKAENEALRKENTRLRKRVAELEAVGKSKARVAK